MVNNFIIFLIKINNELAIVLFIKAYLIFNNGICFNLKILNEINFIIIIN